MGRTLWKCDLERAAVCTVHWLCVVLFFALSASAFFFTRSFPADYADEIPVNHFSVFPLTLLGALCIGGLILVLSRRILADSGKQERNIRILFGVVLAWVLLFGAVFIVISGSAPVSDQLMVIRSAEKFLEGDFESFRYGRYLYYYPSQLGLAAYEELVFRICGSGEQGIRALQVLNVAGMGLSLTAGYKITRYLFRELRVTACFLLLYGSCFPFLMYSVYVYGDVPATALSLVAVWQLLRYKRDGKKSALVLMILTVSTGVLIRNNSLIVLIACISVLLVPAVSKRNWKYCLSIVLLASAVFGVSHGVKLLYEARSGEEIHDGMPAVLWIAMGMQEGDKEAGWYNGYSMYTYQDVCQYNGEAAAELGKAEIRKRAKDFLKNPFYAADFYVRKFTSQWNEPTYGCFIMTLATEEDEERTGLPQSIYYGKVNKCLLIFMDSYQFLIYALVLLLLLKKRKEKEPLDFYLLLIVILGGALFHILWEAKSRYVLPYFVMMLPMAAGGLYQMADIISHGRAKDEAAEAGR